MRITQGEQAEGAPGSEARHAQAVRLWRENRRDLHIRYSRDQRDEWFEWLEGLPEGRSIFMSNRVPADQARRRRRYLRSLGVADNVDLDGPEAQQAIADRMAVMRAANPDHFTPAVQRSRIYRRYDYGFERSRDQWHGHQIRLTTQAHVNLQRRHDYRIDGIQIRFATTVFNETSTLTDLPTIEFADGGINVVMAAGDIVRRAAGDNGPTLPLEHFIFQPDRDSLGALWVEERVAQGADRDAVQARLDAVLHPPPGPRDFAPAGRDTNQRPANLNQLAMGDAAWLVLEFWRTEFPQGGHFIAADHNVREHRRL